MSAKKLPDIRRSGQNERAMAPTRKYGLFAGNEIGAENWALLASLVATCNMSDTSPFDYLPATLQAILDGLPQNCIDALMAWNFAEKQASLHR
jgi:transposase